MKIRFIITAILFIQSISLFAQEKRQVTFEDGKVLEYTFYFDKPYQIYQWSISAHFDFITMEQFFVALNIKPYYEISKKLYIDSKIAIPLGGTKPPFIYEELSKSPFEIFPEIHYELFSNGKHKKANLWLETEYEAEENVNHSYNTKVDYIKRQSLYFDGGVDLGRSSGQRILEDQDDNNGALRLITHSYVALSLGISSRISNHYKAAVSRGGDRTFLKVDQFALKFLVGTPYGELLMRDAGTTGVIDYNPTGYSELRSRGIGARISFDRERGFARKPSMFLKWGIATGLNPTYLAEDSTISDLEGFYFAFKVGLGFGKLIMN